MQKWRYKEDCRKRCQIFLFSDGSSLERKGTSERRITLPPSRKKCDRFVHSRRSESLPRKIVFLVSHWPSLTEVSTLAGWQQQQQPPFTVRPLGAVTTLSIYIILTICSRKYMINPMANMRKRRPMRGGPLPKIPAGQWQLRESDCHFLLMSFISELSDKLLLGWVLEKKIVWVPTWQVIIK